MRGMKAETCPIIQCRKCHGTGKVALPLALLETLRAVPRDGITSYELNISHFPALTPNAQNNRLEELRELGFVTRIREGRFWRYVRAKAVRNGRGIAR